LRGHLARVAPPSRVPIVPQLQVGIATSRASRRDGAAEGRPGPGDSQESDRYFRVDCLDEGASSRLAFSFLMRSPRSSSGGLLDRQVEPIQASAEISTVRDRKEGIEAWTPRPSSVKAWGLWNPGGLATINPVNVACRKRGRTFALSHLDLGVQRRAGPPARSRCGGRVPEER